MNAIETRHAPSARNFVYHPDQLTSKEPHVVVRGVFTVADYAGGGSREIDMLMPTRAHARLAMAAGAA